MIETKDFFYELPETCIAQYPISPRDHSKLLIYHKKTKEIEECLFYEIVNFLTENDVLVFNETKVIPARLFGVVDQKKVEVLLCKNIQGNIWDCLVYPGNVCKVGETIVFYHERKEVLKGNIQNVSKIGRHIEFIPKDNKDFFSLLPTIGHYPLPPYIECTKEKEEAYQTIFGKIEGSIAAPTASFHFTETLVERLKEKGVPMHFVLLHVGLGTFQPVKTKYVEDHIMHKEFACVTEEEATILNRYKQEGKRIIAVGTTVVRVLESFSDERGILHAGVKETDLFIYPGYTWKYVTSMITNFHQPGSTLVMLVASFMGKEELFRCYEYAKQKHFRFLSFGDAMWIRD